MNQTLALSVVMPVHNQQSTVAKRVEHLLDELADLTSLFQVITIDDSSLDATAEVLDDLQRRFPQLHVMRTMSVLGPKAATQIALSRVTGDFVFVQESYEAVDMDGLRQLWELRGDEELVMAQVRTYRNEIDEELLENLANFAKEFERKHRSKDASAAQPPAPHFPAAAKRTAEGRLQMLRRDSIKQAGAQPKASHFEMHRRVKSSII